MKVFTAFLIGMILSLILKNSQIDQFLAGWFSCMGYYVTLLFWNEFIKNKKHE